MSEENLDTKIETETLSDIVKESKENLSSLDPSPTPIKKQRKQYTRRKEGGAVASQSQPDPEKPKADLTPLLSPIIKMPSLYLIRKTGFEGWKVTEEEAQILSQMLDQVARKHIPDIEDNPEMIFFASYAMMMGSKYMDYSSWKSQKEAEEKARKEATSANIPAN